LSHTRSRLPLEVHDKVFTWMLNEMVAGLVGGHATVESPGAAPRTACGWAG